MINSEVILQLFKHPAGEMTVVYQSHLGDLRADKKVQFTFNYPERPKMSAVKLKTRKNAYSSMQGKKKNTHTKVTSINCCK